MKLLLRISFKNLFRQKKRNFLLGFCIAIGMMILIIANSFSHGLVDVLINDVVSYAYGHLVVEGNPGLYYTMIRDKERVEDIIKEIIPEEDLISVAENLGFLAQAVGNGEADNVMVIGVSAESEEDRAFLDDFFTLIEGDFDEYNNREIENPIIISQAKADSLNVGLNDVIKIRFPMVTGQMQSAKLTVVAIANAGNTFMDVVTFLDAGLVKEMAGYQPWESASIQLSLKDPKKTAPLYADLLHDKFKPELISVIGNIAGEETRLLAYKNTDEAKAVIKDNIRIISGNQEKAFSKEGVMLSKKTAEILNLSVGDEFYYHYQSKYRGEYSENFSIDAIYESSDKLGGNVLLVNEEKIHKTYNKYLPADTDWNYITQESPLYASMATEWKLLDRSANSQELALKYKEMRQTGSDQFVFNLVTMYEGASDIMRMESVLNLITVVVVMILFFIILIGVINTLRMTIKERTREIGTVRAIGMQKKDIRNQFIMETILLTFFACISGIIAGLLVMYGLGTISLNVNSALSMILKDGHLHFKLNPAGIALNFLVILIIALFTAYFPARKAANMSAVDALRHYE